MTAPKPAKISQRKKLNLTKNIENAKKKLALVEDTSIVHKDTDFSDKYDTAVLTFIADWHLGAKHFTIEEARDVLEYILNTPNALLFILGDNLNTSILNAVSNMYEDTIYPQEQLDLMVDLLFQVAKQGKLRNYLDGNHERRVYKQTGISLGKQVTKAIEAEDYYAPHFAGNNIILKCPSSPNGKFSFRVTMHHGDGVNFLKMQNLNPGAYIKLVGHWHRFEMSEETIVLLDEDSGDQYLFTSKNIKLPNAGKTPFEYNHLEKTTSHYFAIEISSTKNPHYSPNLNSRIKYPQFIPTMKSIPILNVASNKKKDQAIKNIKNMIDKKRSEYARNFVDKISEATKILELANEDLKVNTSDILKGLYKPKAKKPTPKKSISNPSKDLSKE